MHMHMYHEYESVYEYGSNAFELNLGDFPISDDKIKYRQYTYSSLPNFVEWFLANHSK